MPTHPSIPLAINPDALSAVVFAFQRTIDDLEARAILASRHDPDFGPSSAVEYRDDIDRLAGLLGQLGHHAALPDPERAAVVWFDGTYTIDAGQPVRLTTVARLHQLLEEAVERRHDGRISPSGVIELVAEATGVDTGEVADRLIAARKAAARADRQLEHGPDRQLSRELPGPDTSLR